jgi:hypothetical protein
VSHLHTYERVTDVVLRADTTPSRTPPRAPPPRRGACVSHREYTTPLTGTYTVYTSYVWCTVQWNRRRRRVSFCVMWLVRCVSRATRPKTRPTSTCHTTRTVYRPRCARHACETHHVRTRESMHQKSGTDAAAAVLPASTSPYVTLAAARRSPVGPCNHTSTSRIFARTSSSSSKHFWSRGSSSERCARIELRRRNVFRILSNTGASNDERRRHVGTVLCTRRTSRAQSWHAHRTWREALRHGHDTVQVRGRAACPSRGRARSLWRSRLPSHAARLQVPERRSLRQKRFEHAVQRTCHEAALDEPLFQVKKRIPIVLLRVG